MRRVIPILVFCGLVLAGVDSATSTAAQEKVSPTPTKPPEETAERPVSSGRFLELKIEEQKKRIEANPSSAALHNDLGNLYALRRSAKEAHEQYEIAIRLDKKGFLAPYNMGIVLETQGKTGSAISAYKASARRNPDFPPALFRLARLYEKGGRDSLAIDTYAKALRLDPLLRDPRRNPLVVDTRLLDRVSLTNYRTDLATAALPVDARYGDAAHFRRVAYDRSIYSNEEEAEGTPPASTPASLSVLPATPVTPAPPAPAVIPAAPGQTRPQAIVPAPASAVPPAPTPVRSAPAPAPVPPGAPVYPPTPAPPGITPITSPIPTPAR